MNRSVQGPFTVWKCLKAFGLLLGLAAFVSSPALAQSICNSQAIVNFPNGDNLNRVVGQSLQMSIQITNGPSQNAGAADSQTFTVVHFFPSCLNVAGGVCSPDQGEVAGPPPAIEYIGELATSCPVVPTEDMTNPFDIKFTFSPSITLTNAASCLVTFTVRVAERGDLGSTPANIRQLATTDGVCGSGLTSSTTGSAAITLTCPPCDDSNPCTADTCDATTAQCRHSTPPNCDDGDVCTVDTCIGPNPGDCSHSGPPDCNDNNACTQDRCDPVLGCVHDDISAACDDHDSCTADRCDPASGCVHEPVGCKCDLVVDKTCALKTAPAPAPFVCSGAKPLDSLTLQWAGSVAIRIRAWKGPVGTTLLLADIDNIQPGETVMVDGYAGSPNDVYWQILQPGTTTPIGIGNSLSTFHLSCSDIDMNGPEDCGKFEGDGKSLTGGYINTWIFEGMGGNGKVLDCNPPVATPEQACVSQAGPNPDCTTQGHPTSLTFRYTGGGCAASNNPQSGKFLCSGSINPGLPIVVATSNSGYTINPTTVNPGDEFTVSASTFNAQSLFTLKNAGGTESLSIHTSCSQILAVGNVFGSLTLVGFNGQGAGVEATYTYTVTNNGDPVTNVTLVDTVDGQSTTIAGPFNLATGETRTFQSVADVSKTTTDVATVSGTGANGATCSDEDQLTVTIVPMCVLGYPFQSSNPRTSVVFNESEVLRAFAPFRAGPGDTVKVWYNDEHALTLGVSKVAVKTASGTVNTTYPLAPLSTNPGSSINPAVGTTDLSGDQAGTDLSGRPMFPALFITDITADPTSRAGDWQFFGTPTPPHAVFGTWKGATRTVDKTKTPPGITVTPLADPAKNNWNLGPGSDTPPGGFSSLKNEGYGAEARWNVDDLLVEGGPLLPGHTYRVQFMVHDGDQNKTGGDVGEACMIVQVPQ